MKLFFCQSNQCKISYIQVKVMCDYYLYLGMQTLPKNKQFCETAKTKINRIKKNYLYAYINVNRKKSTCHESICKNAFWEKIHFRYWQLCENEGTPCMWHDITTNLICSIHKVKWIFLFTCSKFSTLQTHNTLFHNKFQTLNIFIRNNIGSNLYNIDLELFHFLPRDLFSKCFKRFFFTNELRSWLHKG